MKKVALVFFISIGLVFSNDIRPKIRNGQEAVPHSIPYQVALSVDAGICGGSLISSRYVLTAAHCVERFLTTAILGAHNIRAEEDEQLLVSGIQVKLHPEYNSTSKENDIALVLLAYDVPFNEYIQPVLLAESNTGLLINETAKISGWGYTDHGFTEMLHYAESTIMNSTECQNLVPEDNFKTIYDSMLCLDGSNTKGPCDRDDGGPLVVNGTNGEIIQVGIESFLIAEDCRDTQNFSPSVFTRVSDFADWIKENSDATFMSLN